MNTYTKREADEAMKKLFTSIIVPSILTKIDDTEVLQYRTDKEGFTMNVRLADGLFFGYDYNADNGYFEAPTGFIQSIKK